MFYSKPLQNVSIPSMPYRKKWLYA